MRFCIWSCHDCKQYNKINIESTRSNWVGLINWAKLEIQKPINQTRNSKPICREIIFQYHTTSYVIIFKNFIMDIIEFSM